MNISQNCAFTAHPLEDAEYEDPKGASLARLLAQGLDAAGWTTSEIENWRDCGWSVSCERDQKRLEVALASSDDGKWMLQVAPQSVAGFFSRILGRSSSASPEDVLHLARKIDDLLKNEAQAKETLWRWDGFPKAGNASPNPG